MVGSVANRCFARLAGMAWIAVMVLTACAGIVRADDSDLSASAYKMSGSAKQTRVEIKFDRDPSLRWFLLRAPYRLVIELPKTRFLFEPNDLKAKGLVTGIRYGETGDGRARIMLSSSKPFAVDDLAVQPDGKGAFALTLNLKSSTRAAFDKTLSEQSAITSSVSDKPQAPAASDAVAKKFVLVVDPGHGGADGGAKSSNGTVEKEITLAFATGLKKMLEATGRYTVLMTRESDVFIPLGGRVEFARKNGAQLFISIHADTIRVKGLRGATVYTVSDKASDADAAALADRENLADQFGGIVIEDDNQQVADILVDLIRRETHGFSVSFARTLVGELSDAVKMIKNPHRHAGFRVLRAPDVPSVLIELGYLSNDKDEEQLLSEDWRAKAAKSIVEAVDTFAGSSLRAGG